MALSAYLIQRGSVSYKAARASSHDRSRYRVWKVGRSVGTGRSRHGHLRSSAHLDHGDLAKGTGRFNLLQGAVQSAMGLGGVLSNSLFGFIAKMLGFNASFWGLSAVAVLGGLLYQFRMPETRPENDGQKNHARSAAAAKA